MAVIQSHTPVRIESSTVTLTRNAQGWQASILANRERWTGEVATSPGKALQAMLAAVKSEKRPREKGRPPDRYKIAKAII